MFSFFKVKLKPKIPRLKQFFICCNSGNVTVEDKDEEVAPEKKPAKGDCEQPKTSYNIYAKIDLL